MSAVQVVVSLDVDGPLTPAIRDALANLADVMQVQAEDGLWTLGAPESEGDVPNEHLAALTVTGVEVRS